MPGLSHRPAVDHPDGNSRTAQCWPRLHGLHGKYDSKYNQTIEYRGGQNFYPDYRVPALSSTNPGLILNIGHTTTSTVTFTFSRPVSSVALDIYDISRSTNSERRLRYTDTVSFSQPVAVTGTMNSANASSLAAGQTFYRTNAYTSETSIENTFTTTTTAPMSSFTVTYTAPVSRGWQFIALGGMTICL